MIPFRKSIFRNIVLWYTLCVSVVIGVFAWLLYDEIERGRRKPFEVRLVSQSAFLASRLYHTGNEVDLTYPYLPDADLSNSFFAVYSTYWQPFLVSVPWRRVRWSPGILNHKKLAERVAANKSYYGTAKDDRDEDMRFCVTRKLLKPPPEMLSFSAESGDELEVYIVCAALYEPIDQYLGFRRHRLLTTALILCAVILLSGLGVALLGVRPIVRLARAARAITPEDPRTRFPVDKLPDELRYLADRTNEAFNRLDAALASERHFTAAAAHEMRSPVAELVARLDVLRRSDGITLELKDKVDRIYADAERLRKLSGQLLLLARLDRAAAGEPFQKQEVDLNDIAIDAADFCRAKAHDRDIGITVNSRGDTTVQGREEWLLRAVYNIVGNAVKYSPDRGEVTVRVEPAADGRRVVVTVTDEGPGIPPGERVRVFERFYRSSVARGTEGTGIGLAIVSDVAKAHKGLVFITAGARDAGTTVTLILPR